MTPELAESIIKQLIAELRRSLNEPRVLAHIDGPGTNNRIILEWPRPTPRG
jgi:hypothetical protein